MSDWTLEKNAFAPRKGPVVVVVLDGVGVGPRDEGDAVFCAETPTFDRLVAECPSRTLLAHGKAVGLPSDKDMGNSEVGHNALGAGRVYDQGAKLVDEAIDNESLFAGEAWRSLVANCREKNTPMHFIGLLSDGNVHSHIDQLTALIQRCDVEGITALRVHPLLDGRDVGPQTSLTYIDALEATLAEINTKGERDYVIASGGGRMLVTMDRYEADWSIVERGWKAHVLGEGRSFASAREAVESYRRDDPRVTDQNLGEFVITRDGEPVGTIEDDHSVILFNFRGDRAIEITRAFDDEEFSVFDCQRRPKVVYAGMMQYDGDLGLPKRFLVSPPSIERTLGEYLAKNGLRQFACAETQKFGHVTYFWNGNRSGKFDAELEDYVECPSDRVSFDERPWMKAAEVTDATIEALESGRYDFMRINYANGDMVGHTGDSRAARLAVEVVDLCLSRLLEALDKAGGVALITADHGNSDEMFERAKDGSFVSDPYGGFRAKTSHTLNPVPFVVYDPTFAGEYQLDPTQEGAGLSQVAATVLFLLGFDAPAGFDPTLIESSKR
ncbi:MAG: 2,3-bisphosphoglycerate-independent phosphoglycerate mutase [Deltaproteobacteria bacterium]|nr:2,3-bisphosphoglycerate-independent phosphoglycerate mutase [Deltaproteobacteria bacterium]